MKHVLTVLALLAASGCGKPPPASPPAAAAPAQIAGAPCDPPLVVPASIIESVKAQFEEGRTTPPPKASDADRAAYQTMQATQRAVDWGNLCRYRAANEELAKAAPEPSRVVFMGDSITSNWGIARPAFFNAVSVNRGIAGQTTPQMLLRFRADVIALKPAVVHIMAGVNDIAQNTGPSRLEDIEDNIVTMVELAQLHGIKVILATPLPAAKFTWAPQLEPKEPVVELVAWTRKYAAEQHLTLADYYPTMATPDDAMKPELTLDGVHPNLKGYQLMEPITQAAIRAALGQ